MLRLFHVFRNCKNYWKVEYENIMEQEKNLCDRIDSVFDKLTDAQKQTAIFLKRNGNMLALCLQKN